MVAFSPWLHEKGEGPRLEDLRDTVGKRSEGRGNSVKGMLQNVVFLRHARANSGLNVGGRGRMSVRDLENVDPNSRINE